MMMMDAQAEEIEGNLPPGARALLAYRRANPAAQWFLPEPGGGPSRRELAESGQLLPEDFTDEEKAAQQRGAVKSVKLASKHALRSGEVGGLTPNAALLKQHVKAKIGPFSDINQLAMYILDAYIEYCCDVDVHNGVRLGRAAARR